MILPTVRSVVSKLSMELFAERLLLCLICCQDKDGSVMASGCQRTDSPCALEQWTWQQIEALKHGISGQV
jgi:hypothetical protein